MTRTEFVDAFAAELRRSRKVNHPDIRLSEEMAAKVGDQRLALKLWRRHRVSYLGKTVEQFHAELRRNETKQ